MLGSRFHHISKKELFSCKLHHSAQILAYNIKFYIDHATNLYCMEIGMLESIRNDCDLKSILCRITYSKAYTIHSHRTLVNRKIATFSHFRA